MQAIDIFVAVTLLGALAATFAGLALIRLWFIAMFKENPTVDNLKEYRDEVRQVAGKKIQYTNPKPVIQAKKVEGFDNVIQFKRR